jgi:hypothetical protein
MARHLMEPHPDSTHPPLALALWLMVLVLAFVLVLSLSAPS